MNVRTAWICCLLAGTVIFHCEGIQWLGLYRHSRAKKDPHNYRSMATAFSQEECNKGRSDYGFRKRQLRFCRNEKFRHSMPAIMTAAKVAVYHCGQIVSDRRWNCSSTRHLPKLSPDLQHGNREQAFVYAFASAAMVYAIARGCAEVSIKYCHCDTIPDNTSLPNSTYRWGGCHDNLEVAERYVIDFLGLRRPQKRNRRERYESTKFYDSRPPTDLYRPPANRQRRHPKRKRRRKRSKLKLMNNHNYMAGVRIMDQQRKLFCKCHGVSGSCTIRTCSYRVRRFDDSILIRVLRENYLKAIQVEAKDNRLVPKKDPRNGNHLRERTILPTDLVFINHSPDYCQPDPEVGSFGTKGRKCNATISGSFSCGDMCCGRGYSILRQRIVSHKCECRFISESFKVKCKTCTKTITSHICN